MVTSISAVMLVPVGLKDVPPGIRLPIFDMVATFSGNHMPALLRVLEGIRDDRRMFNEAKSAWDKVTFIQTEERGFKVGDEPTWEVQPLYKNLIFRDKPLARYGQIPQFLALPLWNGFYAHKLSSVTLDMSQDHFRGKDCNSAFLQGLASMVYHIVDVFKTTITVYFIISKRLRSTDCHSCFQKTRDDMIKAGTRYAIMHKSNKMETINKAKKNCKRNKAKCTNKKRKQKKDNHHKNRNPSRRAVKERMQKCHISKRRECTDQQSIVYEYMTQKIGGISRRGEIMGTSLVKWSWTYDRGPYYF